MNENVRFNVGLSAIVFSDLNDTSQQRHKWTAEEMNVVMAILSKMKDMDSTQEEEISMTYLLELSTGHSKGEQVGKAKLIRTIRNIDKRQNSIYLFKRKSYLELPLFGKLEITDDDEDFTLHVRLSTAVEKYFTNSRSRYLRFKLSEYIALKSVYSKLLYVHLKQFRTRGQWSVNFDVFKALLGKPNVTAGYVNRKILPVALKECSRYFVGLSYRYQKKGKKIVRIVFEFNPEVDTNNRLKKYHIANTDNGVDIHNESTPKDTNNVSAQ